MAQPTGNRSSIMINGTQLCDYHLQEDDNYGELSRNPETKESQVLTTGDRFKRAQFPQHGQRGS